MWDNRIVSCCRTEEGKGFILIEGDYKGVGASQAMRVVLVNVYAPCSDRDKEVLWGDIENVLLASNCLIKCLMGDFNVVRYAFERKGVNEVRLNNLEMVRFNDLLTGVI